MYRIFKRCFDFTSALLLFICISPLFGVLALLVRINLGMPKGICCPTGSV